MGPMLDTHIVARSLTDAEFTPAQARRHHERDPGRAWRGGGGVSSLGQEG